MQDFYIITLKQHLSDRSRRNPQYSLRAFSRDLKMTPSRLSQVLNGQLGLSGAAARAIASSLGLDAKASELFYDSVMARFARSATEKQLAQIRLKKMKHETEIRQMSLDVFNLISDWYHYGLLELFTLKKFKHDYAWMASALGIDEKLVLPALERLCRVGLLRREKSKFVLNTGSTMTPTDIPSSAIKAFHEGLLRKAMLALDQQSVEQRDFSSTVFSVPTQQLPELKKELREFRKHLLNKYESADDKTAVYCLGVQLFNLTPKLNDH